MPSPFPRMDPFLEAHWRDVHASLIVYARNEIQRQLPPGLVAGVDQYISLEIDEQVVRFRPDASVMRSGTGLEATAATLELDEADVYLTSPRNRRRSVEFASKITTVDW